MSVSMCCADVEFGRLQARDLLQHLWTGPISNAPVNIVQGSKSVEVRPVGISKVKLCPHLVMLPPHNTQVAIACFVVLCLMQLRDLADCEYLRLLKSGL